MVYLSAGEERHGFANKYIGKAESGLADGYVYTYFPFLSSSSRTR